MKRSAEDRVIRPAGNTFLNMVRHTERRKRGLSPTAERHKGERRRLTAVSLKRAGRRPTAVSLKGVGQRPTARFRTEVRCLAPGRT